MHKIPTAFVRDRASGAVTEQVTPGCEWVRLGEGLPTRKYDGTCILLDAGGSWWTRRQVKPGKRAPEGFWPIETDRVTGKTFGWEPAARSPFQKALDEALAVGSPRSGAGTYELCGPKVNGNPEGLDRHRLFPHAEAEVLDVPDRSYAALREQMSSFPHEGIVFHLNDGRMAKIKRKDFMFDDHQPISGGTE